MTRRLALALAGTAVGWAQVPAGAPAEPARTLASFEVRDLDGRRQRFETAGKVTVVVFFSAVCPISNDYNERMNALYGQWQPKGVQFLFVNANSNEGASEIEQQRKEAGFAFPVYKDRGNVLADRLGATVTPETFVLDRQGTVRYQGHIDDSRNPVRARVHGLRNAIESVLAGSAPQPAQTKAFGCTIKRERKDS